MEDEQIIWLLERRNEQAIDQLHTKYGTLLRQIAENILNNPLDAEECVNDAYLAIWNSIPPGKPDSLKGFLFRILRNQAIKKYHYNTAKKRNSFYDVALAELEECISSGDSMEQRFLEKQLTEALNRFLGQLPAKDRILFVRRYWYADSLEKIAAESGMSKNRIAVRLFRVREKLKRDLEKEGFTI